MKIIKRTKKNKMITINDVLMLIVTVYCVYNVYSVQKPNIQEARIMMSLIYSGMIFLGIFVPEFSALIFMLVFFPEFVKGVILTYSSICEEWNNLHV
jgi:hypothetical protein